MALFQSTLSKLLSAVTISRHAILLPRHYSTSQDENTPKFNMKNPFEKDKQICILCKHNITPNYKNVKLLSQFQSSYTGRVYGRHITGLCKAKQAKVEAEIQKSQSAGLMGTYLKEVTFLKDPKLFDIEHSIRPHNY